MKISMSSIQATSLGLIALAAATTACSRHPGSIVWSIEKTTNPLNDVESTKARTQLIGKSFDLDLVVVCTANGEAAYQFRAFDKAKNAEDFQTGMFGGSLVKGMQLRLDGGKPFNRTSFTHDFSNQFVLTQVDAKDVASAKQVVVHAPLQNGDETYTLDQEGADFRNAMQPCVSSQAAANNPSPPVSVPIVAPLPPSTTTSSSDPTAAQIAEVQRWMESAPGANPSQATIDQVKAWMRRKNSWRPKAEDVQPDEGTRPVNTDEVR